MPSVTPRNAPSRSTCIFCPCLATLCGPACMTCMKSFYFSKPSEECTLPYLRSSLLPNVPIHLKAYKPRKASSQAMQAQSLRICAIFCHGTHFFHFRNYLAGPQSVKTSTPMVALGFEIAPIEVCSGTCHGGVCKSLLLLRRVCS